MTVLSSRDGKFYEFPEADLKKHEVPAERVKEILGELDAGMDGGPGGVEPYSHGGPAQVVIHVSGSGATLDAGPPDDNDGSVQPYGYYGHGHGWGHGHGHGWGGHGWGYRRRRRWYW